MSERPSHIPVPINKRASLILAPSTNAPNLTNSVASSSGVSASHSRSSSPLPLAKPPFARRDSATTRRQSLLLPPGSRTGSISENGDDPTRLKAQIALLQSSLHASHQRIMEMTSGLNLNTSTSTSPGGTSPGAPGSPLPWTPVNGLMGLPEVDGLTPGGIFFSPRRMALDSASVVEETEGGMEDVPVGVMPPNGTTMGDPSPDSQIARLPHSNPSYDLQSRATHDKALNGDSRLGLSRIPYSAVQHAVSLHPTPPRPHSSIPRPPPSQASRVTSPTSDGLLLRSPFSHHPSPGNISPHTLPNGSLGLGQPSSTPEGRLSPGLSADLRRHTGPGGRAASTRVIDGLQTDLLNTKVHLERVKQEVRSNQRLIGSLQRQSGDLSETKERMRKECEFLNTIIVRRERSLQETLDRAKKAESSLSQHQSTSRTIEQTAKKAVTTMTAQLLDAQASQAKAEREAVSLRDSVKSLRDVWAREIKTVREEWKQGTEKERKDREGARNEHLTLVKLVQAQSAERREIQELARRTESQAVKANEAFERQAKDLKVEVERSGEECREAKSIATELASELVRLRRLMRGGKRDSLEQAASPAHNGVLRDIKEDEGT